MSAERTYAPQQSEDLSQPLYGASLAQAVSRFFRKYGTFTGRASRSEFWWWFLVNFIVTAVLSTISSIPGSGWNIDPSGVFSFGVGYWLGVSLSTLWFFATIVPSLALTWRRLHDANKPGPFYFLGLIPLVGWIIVLVFYALPSDPAGARFDR